MTVIRKQDVISSVADALQYISYYHPLDFVQALEKAYEKEESQAAKMRSLRFLSTHVCLRKAIVLFVRIQVLLLVS